MTDEMHGMHEMHQMNDAATSMTTTGRTTMTRSTGHGRRATSGTRGLRRLAAGALATVASVAILPPGGGFAAAAQDGVAADDAVRAMEPTPIRGLIAARPFRVEKAFPHTWRAEKPMVTGGWLLVLEVDPELVYPRQTAMPVLFAGRETAARVNVGYGSGRLVVIVPDRLGKDGRPVTALEDLPIWFGDANLPERITAADVAAARQAADAAGIGVRSEAERTAAVARGTNGATMDEGGMATYADRMDLMLAAMRLVKEYAPDETDLADGWLVTEQP